MTETLLSWLAIGGPAGVLAVMAAERFLPVLPSYGTLILIGTAAAAGALDPTMAAGAAILGSAVGCLGWYAVGLALQEQATAKVLARWGRLFGLSPTVWDRAAEACRQDAAMFAFVSQAIPTVRVAASLPVGLLRLPLRQVALPTLCGLTAWNALFLSLGYFGGEWILGSPLTLLLAVVALVAAELALAVILRNVRRVRLQTATLARNQRVAGCAR